MKALKSKLAKAILADARNREKLSNFLDQNNTISDYSQKINPLSSWLITKPSDFLSNQLEKNDWMN